MLKMLVACPIAIYLYTCIAWSTLQHIYYQKEHLAIVYLSSCCLYCSVCLPGAFVLISVFPFSQAWCAWVLDWFSNGSGPTRQAFTQLKHHHTDWLESLATESTTIICDSYLELKQVSSNETIWQCSVCINGKTCLHWTLRYLW